MKQVLPLAAGNYQRHAIHGGDRIWAETNCYADVLIELTHALGFEPIAALPFTLAIDFEGDQWTFFKFPHADMQTLFGMDIQELAIWRPLIDHLEEQVGLGRPVLVELDSYFLPDTAGSAYQLEHTKTTVAINRIDVKNRVLGYFHSQSYFELSGDDFTQVFQLDGLVHPRMLPPYVEIVKLREQPRPGAPELVERSQQLLRRQVALAPRNNPFHAFKEKFSVDLDWLMSADIEVFHKYSFATLRQFGACYELSATYLHWLAQQGIAHAQAPGDALLQIAQGAKALQFQLARAIARKKPLELSALDTMAEQWEQAMSTLQKHQG